jgi:chaperonin GroEL
MTCEFDKPYVLLVDRELNSIHDLMKPLEVALESSKPILVIANDINGDALQGLVLNKVKGALRVCAIKSPGFGSSRHDMLIDLQTVIGGTVITDSFDMSKFNTKDFGQCAKIITQRNMTTIVANENNDMKSEINNRISVIKKKLEENYNLVKGEKELLTYRMQQLSGGIAILRVGAATESELIERYDRVDDALNATKAALQEGILPGGGVALVRTKKCLKNILKTVTSQDIKAGIEIMIRVTDEPFRQIIKNGHKSPDAILSKVLISAKDTGYDARADKFGNMYKLGIVDPHKVVRCSIENAVSAATMLLNVGCCLVDVKQITDGDNYS